MLGISRTLFWVLCNHTKRRKSVRELKGNSPTEVWYITTHSKDLFILNVRLCVCDVASRWIQYIRYNSYQAARAWRCGNEDVLWKLRFYLLVVNRLLRLNMFIVDVFFYWGGVVIQVQGGWEAVYLCLPQKYKVIFDFLSAHVPWLIVYSVETGHKTKSGANFLWIC